MGWGFFACPAGFSSYRNFFFNDTATTEIYTLSLHDALPISALADLGEGLGEPALPPAPHSPPQLSIMEFLFTQQFGSSHCNRNNDNDNDNNYSKAEVTGKF